MPKFAQLNQSLAWTIKELFPPQEEHFDLVSAFQRWGTEEIELSPAQVQKTLSAIRQYAIPRTQALVWRTSQPELRRDAEAMLDRWKALEALLAAAT
jgi:hypothetical protein